MIEDTINEGRTVAGGGKDMILAGRYHILRQSGPGGMGAESHNSDMIYWRRYES